ncbi:MAG TPA: hypothetical protein IGS40_04590 [Trichormus sp. M33_DOE_039]|nr:hypothetical protein [Trichormus sp. M33_DOE_039]
MSIEMITSDLLVDLSTTEQQIIAGGQDRGDRGDFRGDDRDRDRRYYCRYCYDCRPYRD